MTRLLTIIGFTTIFSLGCASVDLARPQGPAPSLAGDKTQVTSSCEGSLGRGYEICRYTAGTPIGEHKITVFIPWPEGSVAATVKVRSLRKDLILTTESPFVEILYSEILDGESFNKSHDGPIQVVTTSLIKDGTRISVLGYIFLIVTAKGYNPLPGRTENSCRVSYDKTGRSDVRCDH